MKKTKKLTFTPKTLKELEFFLKKYKLLNSIKTSSELLGYFTSIACSPDYFEPPDWFFRIWTHIGEEFTLFESEKEIQQFENLCNLLMEDCAKKFDDYTINDYFLGKYKVNLTEWCQGFLRGRVFWTHYFGEIFENQEKNKIDKTIENNNSNEGTNIIPNLGHKIVAIKKADFVETTKEEMEDFDEIISKDANFHKTMRDDELDEILRINALTFIGLVSLIGEPKLVKKDFGVFSIVNENTKAQIPQLIYSFQEYIQYIAYDFIPENGMELALEEIKRDRHLNDYSEDELDILFADDDSKYNKKSIPILNLTSNDNRNQMCPCGSGKKFKKCCENE